MVRLLICSLFLGAPFCRGGDVDRANGFVDPSTSISGHICVVKVRVAQSVLNSKVDTWCCVQPTQAPDTVWLQGAPLDLPLNDVVVYLGEAGNPRHRGDFIIRLVTFPKGIVSEDGPLKLRDAKRKGMKTIASCIVKRVD